MDINQLKYLVKKTIGRADLGFQFEKFERELLNKKTIDNFLPLRDWAANCYTQKSVLESVANYLNSPDPIIRQWHDLSTSIKSSFKDRQLGNNLRILIHIPNKEVSPAGFSLFTNLLESLDYLGLEARSYTDSDNFSELVKKFEPNIFLTSDNEIFLNKVDWRFFANYRKSVRCELGLTASLEEYGNTALATRLDWAKDHGVDFYYSFRSPEYIKQKQEYQEFLSRGYKILNLEFGANILLYYPVPGIAKDLDYIFLGSGNYSRYLEYFYEILQKYSGFVAGVGWTHFDWVAREHQRYLYSRAKLGLNISGLEHTKYPSELTERTYILAALGVPQLIDHPKLLFDRFNPDMIFAAENPEEYTELFSYILNNPGEAQARALKAQERVLSKYTNLHRADSFITQIYDNFVR